MLPCTMSMQLSKIYMYNARKTLLYLWLHQGCHDFSNKIFGHGAMTLGTAEQ